MAEGLQYFVHFVVGTIGFAFWLWISLKLFDAGNTTNKFGTALLFAPFFALLGMLHFYAGLLGLIALLFLLVKFYDVGLIRSFLVAFVMGGVQLGILIVTSPIAELINQLA